MTTTRKLLVGRFAVKDAVRGEVSAVFATVAPQVPDLDGDVYAPGAIRPADNIPLSAWNHGSSVTGGPLPVGGAKVRTTGSEAVAEVAYWMDLPEGRAAFEAVRRLSAVQWSWSLDIHQTKQVTLPDGRAARQIVDVTPLEVSPVMQAAGVGTRTLDVRSAASDAERELLRWVAGAHDRRVRDGLAAIRSGGRSVWWKTQHACASHLDALLAPTILYPLADLSPLVTGAHPVFPPSNDNSTHSHTPPRQGRFSLHCPTPSRRS